jgi:hypothetical protein
MTAQIQNVGVPQLLAQDLLDPGDRLVDRLPGANFRVPMRWMDPDGFPVPQKCQALPGGAVRD